MPNSEKTALVMDINVFVSAVVGQRSTSGQWPTVPGGGPNPAATCVGIANDGQEFSLWLSPHILDNTYAILVDKYNFAPERAEEYCTVLEDIALASGGDIIDPPRVAHTNRDHEDNLILDLAVAADAKLLVSNDTDLTSMRLFRGTPVMTPRDFSARVDGMRRQKATTRDLQVAESHERAALLSDIAAEPSTSREKAPAQTYIAARTAFAADHDRLTHIVGEWNSDKPAIAARQSRWMEFLSRQEQKLKNIDATALENPETAADALVTIQSNVTKALDNLDPTRRVSVTHRSELGTNSVYLSAQPACEDHSEPEF